MSLGKKKAEQAVSPFSNKLYPGVTEMMDKHTDSFLRASGLEDKHDYDEIEPKVVEDHKTLLKAYSILDSVNRMSKLKRAFPDCKALKQLVLLKQALEVVE